MLKVCHYIDKKLIHELDYYDIESSSNLTVGKFTGPNNTGYFF